MSELNRRQAIAGLGTISLGAVLAACGEDEAPRRSTATTDLFGDSSACTLTPEQTEGPYYFDVDSVRSDIREDREGVPLRLALRIRDAERCERIREAVVDIWHCDAARSYSGFEEDGTFLRGAQVTDADGTERITAAVYRRPPYASDTGRDAFNRTDSIFDERLLLDLSEAGDGYLGVISFDVERT
jgi:hypothetical protein